MAIDESKRQRKYHTKNRPKGTNGHPKGLPRGYTNHKRRFETPEDLAEIMMEYLEYIHDQNQAKKLAYCENCGTIEPDDDECCDNQSLKYKLITKTPGDKVNATLTGFCAYIGASSKTMFDYANLGEGYGEVIDWFKTILQSNIEDLLLNPTNRNSYGAKFVAINHYGWKDKSEVEHLGIQPVSFIDDISKPKQIEENDDSDD